MIGRLTGERGRYSPAFCKRVGLDRKLATTWGTVIATKRLKSNLPEIVRVLWDDGRTSAALATNLETMR